MAIKFICSCGKHLRARDEMAMRRSVCPRCGNPVGIPSLRPHAPGEEHGPMTPQERLRWAQKRRPPPAEDTPPPRARKRPRNDAPPEAGSPVLDAAPPRPLDPTAVRQATSPKPPPRRHSRPLGTRWYHCLLYPFHAGLSILGLAIGLTALSAGVLVLLPVLAAKLHAWDRGGPDGPALVGLLAVLVLIVVGDTWGFLARVLASAATGDIHIVRWPERNLRRWARSTLLGVVCFLAGPIGLPVVAFQYWLYAGDLGVLDWVILAELAVATVAWWTLAVVAATWRGRLLDATTWGVVRTVWTLGPRVVAVCGLAGVVVLAHGLALSWALVHVKSHFTGAVVGLLACWLSLLFWMTFLFRLLGTWCRVKA
jgi:hypothetical protein